MTIQWSTERVYAYVACCFGDKGDEPGDCYTRVGQDEDGFWVDDGDGDVRVNRVGPFETLKEAIQVAQGLAESLDEGVGGEDAYEARINRLEATRGFPSEDGSYALYWWTVLDDSHVVHRYDTLKQAEAAVELFNDALRAQHPGGGLRCGYEARVLEDGEWVEV